VLTYDIIIIGTGAGGGGRVERFVVARLPPHVWHDPADNGEDISTGQQLIGHSDPKTTTSYDRRPAEARCKATRKISVPYFKRWRANE
jgi:hypothetical protein